VSRAAVGGSWLTHRERQIVRILVSGATNREIANRLGLREQTIKNQLSTIYDKLGVRNRLELVVHATRVVSVAGD
jgi:two-component system, NarL family, nitrate/nitrite response regulator NarL